MSPHGKISSHELEITRGPKGSDEWMQIVIFQNISRLNHQVCGQWKCLDREGVELWDIIKLETAPRKKDQKVMLIILSRISDEIMCELDVDETNKARLV